MIRSRKGRRIRERALYALLSESTVEVAARSARMKEEDLRAMLVYPLFRARYHQSRKAPFFMRLKDGISGNSGSGRAHSALLKHGRYTKQAGQERLEWRQLLRACRELLHQLKNNSVN
jgi:hypothetical protein